MQPGHGRLELWRLGQRVEIEPQVLAVLTYLIEHRDRAVSRPELFKRICGKRIVTESALSAGVKAARRAIGDDGRAQSVIRTSQRTGYRFVADVAASAPLAFRSSAPIDGYGIGTSLVAEDCPALDCVKLQAYAGRARRKRSAGKATWPGSKQVFRHMDGDGTLQRDVLALADEAQHGTPLLVPVLRNGTLAAPLPSVAAIREHAARQLAALPPRLRSLEKRASYDVEIAPSLVALAERVDREFH